MGGDIYFLERKKPTRDDHQRLLSIFLGNISATVVDHQLEFSDDHHDHHSFLPKVDEDDDDDDDDDDESSENDKQECRIFWESQKSLLRGILDQCNLTGSTLREQIKRIIDIVRESNLCNCIDKNLRGCNKCPRQATVNQLCSKRFNAALRTSKWKKTHKIPGGIHEFIEVIACTQGRRKWIPFLVELGFRDEFRMAKACEEYNKLIDHLPEIYIGKIEHLNAIVRLVCEAAKISAKEMKIHIGPWRKRDFMQMKWSASSERRFLDYHTDKLWVNPSTQESSNVVAANFQLPMASTVEVVQYDRQKFCRKVGMMMSTWEL